MSEPSTYLPRAILFDWDNTLVDSWPVIHDAVNATMAAMGRPGWSLADTQARVRASMRDTFPEMFGADWERARDVYYAHFAQHHIDRLVAMDGAQHALERLARSGCYLGVVSNKTGHFLRAEAAALGWSGWFGRLIGAQDASFDKPHRAPVDMVLDGSGVHPGPAVWFVGDAAIDMVCARNAGCIGVLVGTPSEADDFSTAEPAYHFADLHACVDHALFLIERGGVVSEGRLA